MANTIEARCGATQEDFDAEKGKWKKALARVADVGEKSMPRPFALDRAHKSFLDDIVSSLPSDCKLGCSYCCYVPVDAHGIEVSIIGILVKEMPRRERARIIGCLRVQAKAEEGDMLDYKQPCAFLDRRDRCSIYAVRPTACRTFISRDAEVCTRWSEGDGNEPDPIHAVAYLMAEPLLAARLELLDDGTAPLAQGVLFLLGLRKEPPDRDPVLEAAMAEAKGRMLNDPAVMDLLGQMRAKAR